ncbi:Zinc finger, PHD-type [Corchorus olitorius]|uniref:Zinc finger, PHD-type n=1 Tax=Corchorus olitorius TaxID=93759 RepID=A0A1R3KSU2_9ROSI|nr:Zinc finger, PHD-type [Corchorus olitorius]
MEVGNTIKHFLHRHPLKLIEEEEVNHEFVCDGCEKSLSPGEGPIYGCTTADCKFYLDKACAQLPKQIQHCFHPCLLFLELCHFFYCNVCFKFGNGFIYRCERCNFDMHVECAQRPNIKSIKDGEEVIQHFTHGHPLTQMVDEDGKKDLQVGYCGICDQTLICSAAAYGCEDCKFFVHKSCIINISPHINNHLFHPSCHAPLILLNTPFSYRCQGCDDKHATGSLAFGCGKCAFQLDVKCALLPTLDHFFKDIADKIQYAGHKHPLVALHDTVASEVDHRCRVCEEKWSLELELDEDPCFGCKRCHLFLHKSCMMKIPQQINHLFHPSCPLTLLTPPSSYKCAGCDDEHEPVSSLAYSCEKCGFQLDVKCALLPTLEDQSKDANKIQHVAHRHPLLALPHNNKGADNTIVSEVEYRCVVCGEKCPLESCFGCERCQFFIHRSCAIEFTTEAEIDHYSHPLHPLTLSSTAIVESTTNRRCGECLGSIDEFMLVYHCAKCNFNLHVDCAKSKQRLLVKYESHSHHLTFFDKTQAVTRCSICDGGHGAALNCVFRCVACDFNLHFYCHPSTPKTITPKCHLHPLTLAKSPFEFELISPEYQDASDQSDDEFYCDVCEEKRFKHESVYYCKECKFIAETRCVISELLPCLTGSEGYPSGDDRAISADEENSALEASIAKRTTEIAQLRDVEKSLKLKLDKLVAELETLKFKHNGVTSKLDQFETDRVLWNYQLNYNLKRKMGAAEASTSVHVTKSDG